MRWFYGWIILLASSATTADTYRWTEVEGGASFSDKPPARAVGPVTVLPSHKPVPQDGVTETRLADQQRYLEAREVERQQAATARAEAARQTTKRKAECAQAYAQLQQLRTAPQVYQRDARGQQVHLSDAARAQVVAQREAQLASTCGGIATLP